jgi:hypothetical protein
MTATAKAAMSLSGDLPFTTSRQSMYSLFSDHDLHKDRLPKELIISQYVIDLSVTQAYPTFQISRAFKNHPPPISPQDKHRPVISQNHT